MQIKLVPTNELAGLLSTLNKDTYESCVITNRTGVSAEYRASRLMKTIYDHLDDGTASDVRSELKNIDEALQWVKQVVKSVLTFGVHELILSDDEVKRYSNIMDILQKTGVAPTNMYKTYAEQINEFLRDY